MNAKDKAILHLALPKGRMQQGVFALLAEAGISIKSLSRGYRPQLSLPNIETKILKPQNIVEMLQLGSRDVGFAGADWVEELRPKDSSEDVVEILDTGLDPVRLVAAAPSSLLENGKLPSRKLIIASEYEGLTKNWVANSGIEGRVVRSYGATEVFPPEDADLIVDNTATGSTLRDNELVIVDTLMNSSTRMYASQAAFADPAKRARIEDLKLLIKAVLEGRRRSMIEVNVSAEQLEKVIDVLPAMQRPTVAPLHGNSGYAVRAAVLRSELPQVIPEVKARGGRDVIVSSLNQIVP